MFHGNSELTHQNVDYSVELALDGARTYAGLTDFGDEEFLEPLSKLIECVSSDVRFSEAGALNFKSTIHRFLVNRLRFQRDLKLHPAILDEDVSDPIIILGMPRTGTTKLQRMISADPQMQKLSLWRLLNPAPFEGEQRNDPAGRMAFAKAVEDATRANPDFTTSHETSANEADEDSYLALLSFDYVMLYCIFPSRTYLQWVRARPQRTAHRFEKQMLQYLQWQDGGRRGRRWVLKNPGAVGFLKPLMEFFPRATFVHSHRDMIEVIPSYCRLMEAIYSALLQPIDLQQHGRDAIDYWAPEMQRYANDRAQLKQAISILDVPYLDIVRDPIPVIRKIYENSGIEFSQTAQTAILQWSDANQQHKHGKAVYSLERYGLTSEMIKTAFPSRD